MKDAGRSRWERLIIWLADAIPRPILEKPEIILLNGTCVVIGISFLLRLTDPNGSSSVLPIEIGVPWAVFMVSGGCMALYGLYRLNRFMDRLGNLILFLACLFLSLNYFVLFGIERLVSGIIFLGLAASKAVGFIRQAAAQYRILQYLSMEAERRNNGSAGDLDGGTGSGDP
jgi:hypothetical protein